MRFSKLINTIDTHTGGTPTRTVISGIPKLPGRSIYQKMVYLKKNMDSFRTLLMWEPRGHKVMAGAIIMEPVELEADVGIIFIEWGLYPSMCGHSTIGAATALVETGYLPVKEPITEFTFDTPAGLVGVKVDVREHTARAVTFKNVPSFLYKEGVRVEVPKLGVITIDIAYGGNFFAIVDSATIGLEIVPSEVDKIIAIGNEIKRCANEQLDIQHPTNKSIKNINYVQLIGPPTLPGAQQKNVVVAPNAVDRSPCGTGTCAQVANLYSKGKLAIGEAFVCESIIGTTYSARVLAETKVGDFLAVVPEITGRAFITGLNRFVVDPDDPLKDGFVLG